MHRRRSVAPRTGIGAVALATGLLLGSSVLGAQTPAPPRPASDQSAQILQELKAIRQLLERLVAQQPTVARPAPPASARVTIKTVPTEHALGRPDAPVTIMEFTDLQCPFCRQFHTTTFERIKRDYIEPGTVRFITRDLPLPTIHPLAMAAARMSRCAAEQGRFWDMRHAILVNSTRLSAELFMSLAADLGLNPGAFAACSNQTGRLDALINADIAEASAAGLTGTPGFVIGRTPPGGQGLTGTRLMGAQPFEAFETQIKELLAPSPQR